MKIKLVIECNPEKNDGEADILMCLFRDLAQVSAEYGRVKLTDGLNSISHYYSTDDSLPKDDPKRGK